jgi:hypothetical protein
MTWIIADIIGNGGPPSPHMDETTGPYRPVAEFAPCRYVIAGVTLEYGDVEGDPPTGHHIDKAWALVYAGSDPALWAATSGCDVLGDDQLDTVLTAQRANQANNALDRHGIPPLAAEGMTYRDVLEAIAHEIDPTWTTDDFGVA